MAAPTAQTVAHARFWLLAAVRAIAVVLLALAAFSLAAAAASFLAALPGLISSGAGLLATVIMDQLARTAPFIVIGALLLKYDRRLIQFLAPSPGAFCQGCGYPLRGLKFAICPECGLAATPADATGTSSRPSGR